MENKTIDKPVDEYKKVFKEKVKANAEKYFDDLAKSVNLNIDENHSLVKKYEASNNEYQLKNKSASNAKGLRVFLIILIVLFTIVGLILMCTSISGGISSHIVSFIVSIVLIVAAFACLLVVCLKINKIVKHRTNVANEAKKVADADLEKCYQNMRDLNMAFDYNMPIEIFNKTTPQIGLDDEFEMKKFAYMVDKFGLDVDNNANLSSSVLACKSGQIQGNPFLVIRTLNQEMYMHTYTGYTTYTYYTTETDSKGNTRTVSHTETLTASVTEPASRYFEKEILVFASPAAPDLSFSRKPTYSGSTDQKKLDKFVQKQTKRNTKLERKALLDNDPNTNYTMMSNDKFEALFNSTDRDNETQFRLMFTPIAQQNMVELITDSPYGDDFSFLKDHKINYIFSNHALQFPYDTNPDRYVSYDFEKSKNIFVTFVCNFFENFYFELAPILSIPIYQQTKPFEFIYKKEYGFNINPYDQERMTNQLKQSNLLHELAKTQGINKTEYITSIGNIDIVNVKNDAFDMVPQVTNIPVTASDGHVVLVPVDWYRYDPVSKTTTCAFIKGSGSSNNIRKNLNDNFNSSNISFANKDSIVYNTNMACFAFDKCLDRVTDYPAVISVLDRLSKQFVENQNRSSNVNKSENINNVNN